MHACITSTRTLSMAIVLLTATMLVTGMAAAVEVGDKAPDFSLPSTMGGEISLSQYRGKKNVLLEFYVAAFSGT